MKAKLLGRILISIACLINYLPADAQNESYRVKNTVSSCLNVRSQPNTGASQVGCLERGTLVTVIGSVPYWKEVRFGNNQQGWVAKKFLDAVNAPGEPVSGEIPVDAYLTIHFVDVGQGDAILIQTHDDNIEGNGIFEGYSILIDGGPYSADYSNPLLPYIEDQAHHNADIEALILTHPHNDHYNGAENISRHFKIRHYYDPGYPSELTSYTAFLNAMRGANGEPARAEYIHIGQANFDEMNWGSELKVEVLYSWNGDPENQLGSGNTEQNNASIVLRIQYGEHVFLFMGDAEGKDREDAAATAQYVEKMLLQSAAEKLKATVLKIAHHGSETSSTLPFIQAVDPDFVVVQSGTRPYGGRLLPDISTLQRYCSHNPNVKIYRTDQGDREAGLTGRAAADGDHIVIKSNGRGQPQVTPLSGG